MKNLIYFLPLILISCFTPVFGQVDIKLREFKEDLLVVRTFEVMSGSLWTSKLSISDGSGEIWSVDLAATKPKNVDENLTTIAKVLNLVNKQGYDLVQTNSGGANDLGVFISNYIFEKRKE